MLCNALQLFSLRWLQHKFLHQIVPYPVRFTNRPDVLIASMSVGIQEALKGCVAVEVSTEQFGSNLNLQTPASERSQEQHHKKFQMSEKLM